MKKVATGFLLIIFTFVVEVTYINYRLEQKLDNLELSQQNILTKVYALERSTTHVKQTLQQALQKQQLNPEDKHKFLLTNIEIKDINKAGQKMEGIN